MGGNDLLSAVNSDMIAVNDLVMKKNKENDSFNTVTIAANTKLMDGILPEKATPEANAKRIGTNAEKIAKIKERNDKYNAEMPALHASIKENRKNVEANAAAIKERRKLILANRTAINENGLKIAALLRVDCFADLAAGLDGLCDEEKANIEAGSTGGGETDAHATNRKAIAANGATLHDLHLAVFSNKSKLLAVRSLIEENRSLLMKNYACAFAGNRLMVNQNTDCIFKNRLAILYAMKVDGQEQINFRNTKRNKAKVDFLEHRSLVNNRVAKGNALMTAANTKLIETNRKLLDGVQADKATPEANATRIEANVKGIAMVMDHVGKYDEKVEAATKTALENRKKIIANSKDIDERRKKILENRAGVVENGGKVSAQIRAAAA